MLEGAQPRAWRHRQRASSSCGPLSGSPRVFSAGTPPLRAMARAREQTQAGRWQGSKRGRLKLVPARAD